MSCLSCAVHPRESVVRHTSVRQRGKLSSLGVAGDNGPAGACARAQGSPGRPFRPYAKSGQPSPGRAIIAAVADQTQIRTALRTVWQRVPDECAVRPMQLVGIGPSQRSRPGGLNSRTWDITVGDRRFVAKLVPSDQRATFEAGLCAAEYLAGAGIAAGAPVRAESGGLTAALDGSGVLALLEYVPGRPLSEQDPVDQQWWGDLLGSVHRALLGFAHPGLNRWHWVRPEAEHLDLADWIRPAVADAVTAMTKLCVTDQLTYGVLHGDPAPEAFRLDPANGRTGLIDWGAAGTGPLVYDIASAVMYAGGPAAATELLDGYTAVGPVPPEEIDAALPTMLGFRWAVQADYFARRLHAGVGDPAHNRVGLEDARRALSPG
jgi:Ser/Thr protein kinase RdoA (MazF antagonist)